MFLSDFLPSDWSWSLLLCSSSVPLNELKDWPSALGPPKYPERADRAIDILSPPSSNKTLPRLIELLGFDDFYIFDTFILEHASEPLSLLTCNVFCFS